MTAITYNVDYRGLKVMELGILRSEVNKRRSLSKKIVLEAKGERNQEEMHNKEELESEVKRLATLEDV